MPTTQKRRSVGIVAAWIGFSAVLITACAVIAVPFIENLLNTTSGKEVEYLGQIIDANSSKAIAGAKVSLNFQGVPPIVYTDSEGVYRFKVAVESEISGQIRVEAEGYEVYTRNITISQNTQLEDIRLIPAGTIKEPTDTTSELPTNTPSVKATTTSPPIILLVDTFNDGEINNSWKVDCPSAQSDEYNGQLNLKIESNQSEGWEKCEFGANVAFNAIQKVIIKATYTNGTNEGWLGILSSCGSNWLNFMMNSEWVGYSGGGIQRTPMETFGELPVTRTLSMEWTGENVIFTVVEAGQVASIPCTEPPSSLEIGIGTNPGAFAEGSIDEVWIYGISPVSTNQYPSEYIGFVELINGKIESTNSEYFLLNTNDNTFCFNNPAASSTGYFLAIQPRNTLSPFDGVSFKTKIETITGNWASIGLTTLWGDAETGIKLGVYYIGPGPNANGEDGEISIVTTLFGDSPTESSEVFPIHPDMITPFSLRVEKINGTINFYYNDSNIPFASRLLPLPEMQGTYAQLEGNISGNTNLFACWSDIGVLYR